MYCCCPSWRILGIRGNIQGNILDYREVFNTMRLRKVLLAITLGMCLSVNMTVFADENTKSASTSGETLVSYAMTWNGNKNIHYKIGGPVGRGKSLEEGDKEKLTTDCSGFVAAVYSHFGIKLSAQSETMMGEAKSKTTKQEEAKPGDVCWWSGHVGLYIGDGKMIHINTSDPTAKGYYINVVDLKTYGRAMRGTTTYCRMVEKDSPLLGEGTSKKEVEKVKSSGCLLTESDLTGMPIESSVEASQEMIKLYGVDDLSLVDTNSIDVIRENMGAENKSVSRYIGIACSLLGILLCVYASIIVVAMVLDYTNRWLDISLLGVLSFNRWFVVTKSELEDGYLTTGFNKDKGKTYLTVKMLLFRVAVLFVIGVCLIAHLPLNIISDIVIWFNK